MKKMILSVTVALALVCGSISSSSASALVSRDFLAAGDGFITFDSLTNYEWLDLDQTLNKSFNTVLQSDYVIEHGFRYATSLELYDLYLHTFADPQDTGINGERYSEVFLGNSGDYQENYHEVTTLLNLMSATTPDGMMPYQAAWGLFDNYWDEQAEDRVDASIVVLNDTDGVAILSITDNINELPVDVANPIYGSYLVREAVAVPLPGAIVFLFSGLLAVLGAKRCS